MHLKVSLGAGLTLMYVANKLNQLVNLQSPLHDLQAVTLPFVQLVSILSFDKYCS